VAEIKDKILIVLTFIMYNKVLINKIICFKKIVEECINLYSSQTAFVRILHLLVLIN